MYNQNKHIMKEKIGILGSGIVGKVLAGGFLKHGYETMLGSRSAEKLQTIKQEVGSDLLTGSFSDTAKFADIIVLAVNGKAASEVLKLANPDNLDSKVIIDASNPIAEAPPVHGVLKFFTDLNESLMEKLQKEFPSAQFVKAFSCIGNAYMVNPDFPDGKPTMFISGNDKKAKEKVSEILDLFGFEVADMGFAEAARAIEPLCILWCIPGIKDNKWNHAFKLIYHK